MVFITLQKKKNYHYPLPQALSVVSSSQQPFHPGTVGGSRKGRNGKRTKKEEWLVPELDQTVGRKRHAYGRGIVVLLVGRRYGGLRD